MFAVIIVSYNVRQYLERCLESVLADLSFSGVKVVEGGTGYLRHHLRTWGEFIARQKAYLPLEVRMKAKIWSPLSMPLREFWRRYLRLEGYKDGLHGLILVCLMAFYTISFQSLNPRQN
ncbi:MAG: hypothetical protein QXQ50_08480 [Candidatus Bathyarchaeia archaeon]